MFILRAYKKIVLSYLGGPMYGTKIDGIYILPNKKEQKVNFCSFLIMCCFCNMNH